ncbi:MAG: radical SAM protein [Nitrospirota bacterium]
MKYFLARDAVLKWLEAPHVYKISTDELYELDNDSFRFLKNCASVKGCYAENSEFINYCLGEGILTKNKDLSSHPPLIKSPVPSLRYLELQITNKCNLKCRHCYIGDKDISELSVEKIKNILKEFEEMQGLRTLITGGEPLLHSKFDEINEMLPEFFIRKVLFTNGLLLNKRILKRLNVNEIQISIDGLEDAHDSLRGKGTFKVAINAVKHAIDSGFEVSVSTMIHAKNLEDFDDMDRLFKDLGIKDWTVDIPCITGRLKENLEFQMSPEVGGKYLRYGFNNGIHASASGFACGLHLMAVMADENAAKCTFYADNPVGRIEEGLRNCWHRIKPIRLDELKCYCNYIDSCRGGCRYRASLFGDPCGKDIYKCYFYGII